MNEKEFKEMIANLMQLCDQKADDQLDEIEGLNELMEELISLRKEVANSWFYRRFEAPYKIAQKAKDAFINMPLGERNGKNSYQILNELFKKCNK